LSFFETWLSCRELCRVDSALLCHNSSIVNSHRYTFLQCLRSPHTIYNGLTLCGRVDTFSYSKNSLNIQNAYKFICKKLPSLCDVVGSADTTTSRGEVTEKAVGGVFNYTFDSIERILRAMELPRQGLRFLDAGCGNAIFLTLIQMTFPTAKVSIFASCCFIDHHLALRAVTMPIAFVF
jgi:hypothetical protein